MKNLMTSDGTTLHISKSGQGLPCIFLHGGPGYWSYPFEQTGGPLLESFMEMHYLDQRGCGRSSLAPKGDYSLKRLLLDLEEIKQELKIDKWIVMGHSFGGILATNYAKQHPDSVLSLILLNCTLNKRESNMHQMNVGRSWLEEDNVLDSYESIESFYKDFFAMAEKLLEMGKYYDLQFTDRKNLKVLESLDKELKHRPDFRKYVHADPEFFQDYTRITAEISVPTLVISGKYDNAVGPDHYKKFKFPNMSVTILKDKHHPYLENKEEFRRAIQEFVLAIPTLKTT
ncbi:alpha/beta fold hydrolase [Bacillus arachidis]|uniref:Alpha/beta hydrolase n=1 Tax=Bacillus arachidis TaxID=2819290 RepID=A0ABS3NXZ5_9BACI|nr:alpha/beta hydrolase [Bacillus arachidis]MBO1625814.1 alpha/beta hydrolase [Bacillus arachidis]